MEEKNLQLGERIKQIRKIHKLSQVDFAKSLGVTSSYISKIEKGFESTSDTFLKLVSCNFKVSFEYLKTGKEPENPDDSSTSAIPHEELDASTLINMILNAESNTDKTDVEEILNNNAEWKETREYIDTQFDKLKNFVVCISGNPNNSDSVGRLEDRVSDMQQMWGNACFLAGLKKGLLLMQWAKGEAIAKEIIL